MTNIRSGHNWNNFNLTDSSIILTLGLEFLTSKSCNILWKKSMYGHMWLIFCGTHTCNDLFEFFLTFSLCKLLIYLVFMWVSSSRNPEITKLSPFINTHTYVQANKSICIYTFFRHTNIIYSVPNSIFQIIFPCILLMKWVK